MSVRQVIGFVGAAVGSYFGYPQLGYVIGSAIGGAVDPEVIKGPQLGELAQQTSQEGGPRPITWGTSSPITGNVIASSPPRIVTRRESQGKGGPKYETQSVYRTYAVGVCEGPITSFIRVWRNNLLMYDVSAASQISAEDNAAFLENAEFFLGTYDQLPSSALEAVYGVGATAAHRGTAYMVMNDEDLTDTAGAIPQWIFQVGTEVDQAQYIVIQIAQSGGTTFGYAHPPSNWGTLISNGTPYELYFLNEYTSFNIPVYYQTNFLLTLSTYAGPIPADFYRYIDLYRSADDDVPVRTYDVQAATQNNGYTYDEGGGVYRYARQLAWSFWPNFPSSAWQGRQGTNGKIGLRK